MRRPHQSRSRRKGNTMNSSTSYPQADARRRLRRHSLHGFDRRYFCGTNGCATRLDVDEATGTARCHICGSTRHVKTPTH